MKIKFNQFNMVFIKGYIGDIAEIDSNGSKLIRFYLKHPRKNSDKSKEYELSIPVNLKNSVSDKFHELGFKKGDKIFVKGKFRQNEEKNKYKIIATTVSKTDSVDVNIILLECYALEWERKENVLRAKIKHINNRKPTVDVPRSKIYGLTVDTIFCNKSADRVEALLTDCHIYMIEGSLRFDADTKSIIILGEHIKNNTPLEREIPVAEAKVEEAP